MLRSIKMLQTFRVQVQDESVGKVQDFYFDDQDWVIRYLVVSIDSAELRKEVLVSPAAIEQLDWEGQLFLSNLTYKQIKNSPDVDANKPISRQLEEVLVSHYDWPVYWRNSGLLIDSGVVMHPNTLSATVPPMPETLIDDDDDDKTDDNPHLRSMNEVFNYQIQARDGDAGHVEDFLIGDQTWRVNYMIVDTSNWLPGRKVLVSPSLIQTIDWLESKVDMDLSQETIQNSPEYDPSALLDERENE